MPQEKLLLIPGPESRRAAHPRRPGPADRLPRRAGYGPRPQGGLREPPEDRLLCQRRALHRRRRWDAVDGDGPVRTRPARPTRCWSCPRVILATASPRSARPSASATTFSNASAAGQSLCARELDQRLKTARRITTSSFHSTSTPRRAPAPRSRSTASPREDGLDLHRRRRLRHGRHRRAHRHLGHRHRPDRGPEVPGHSAGPGHRRLFRAGHGEAAAPWPPFGLLLRHPAVAADDAPTPRSFLDPSSTRSGLSPKRRGSLSKRGSRTVRAPMVSSPTPSGPGSPRWASPFSPTRASRLRRFQ